MTPHTPPPSEAPTDLPEVPHLERKAKWLLLLMAVVLIGSVLYVLYARGVFERTQRLVLIADDSEGVSVGMSMTFAGFSIGRVTRIELADDGNVRIVLEVPKKDAKWLRTGSIFTLERGLVGGTRIRAFTGVLEDPPLPDGAERPVLRGDAAAEIPKLTASIRDLLANLTALTGEQSPLAQSLANTQAVTDKLKGPQGALGVLMGNEADARRIVTTIERTNALLARADALTARLDGLVRNADAQVFGAGAPAGQGSVVGDVRSAVSQLHGLLADARNSLQKVDAVLVEAKTIASNTREATTDLDALRAEVEASLRKVQHLVNEVNRKWPLARDAEVKLP